MTTHQFAITDLESLGAAVRTRRELAGMTLDEAADLLGVSRRFLIELEHGRRRASIDRVLAVLAAFGLELVLQPRRVGQPVRANGE